MNQTFKNAVATYGSGLVTYIGLLDNGVEITGGGYARKAVTWTGAASAKNPSANLVFDIPAGADPTEWRGYTALTGGTDYGGEPLPNTPPYGNNGTYTLLAASTHITFT